MRQLFVLSVMLGLFATAVMGPVAKAASPPGNDNFSEATLITSLPFADSVDPTLATIEPGEFTNYGSLTQSVWYRFVSPGPGPLAMTVDLSGTDFAWAAVNAYVRDPQVYWNWNNLSPLGTAVPGTPLRFIAPAGYTIYLQAMPQSGAGPNLAMNVGVYPPPANDAFPGTAIHSLPYTDSYDLFGATREPGEPTTSCAGDPPSVWYTYTTPTSTELTASVSDYGSNFAVYTGSSLGDLSLLSCSTYGQVSTFEAAAGHRYFFQVGGQYDQPRAGNFSLAETPPPTASIYGPGDPSTLDTVQFYAVASDPGGIGIQTYVWSFGDGATGSGIQPTHTYTRDGDYTARLVVTTVDGRSASASQAIAVRTHDLAITRLNVPTAASARQTRTISVGIANHHYAESAQVTLYRGVTSPYASWEQIGVQSLTVPVRGGNRTTDATFTYTFTATDASIGKVSFRVVVQVVNARDAFPADNEMTGGPTMVASK